MSLGVIQKPRRAMSASVVKASDLAVFATHGNDRLAHELKGMIVARVRNVVLMANELPRLAENRLLLELEELGVVVDPGRETEAVFVGRGQWAWARLREAADY